MVCLSCYFRPQLCNHRLELLNLLLVLSSLECVYVDSSAESWMCVPKLCVTLLISVAAMLGDMAFCILCLCVVRRVMLSGRVLGSVVVVGKGWCWCAEL